MPSGAEKVDVAARGRTEGRAVGKRTGDGLVEQGLEPRGAGARATREAVDHLGPRKVVQHTDKVDVEAARVTVGIDEKHAQIHVVDPDAVATGTALGHHALNRRTRHHELLEHPGVELGEGVAGVDRAGLAVVKALFGGAGAVAAHNGLHELAQEVVGERTLALLHGQVIFPLHGAGAVGHDVRPLVAVGVTFLPGAAGAEVGGRRPC